MELVCITILSIPWKIIIALHLFKIVADDLGGSELRIQVAQMIHSIYSMLIKAPFIRKEIQMDLLIYLSLKAF